MGNGMMCRKNRHSLLHEWLIPFLECMRMMGWASDSINKPVMVYTKPILPRLTFKLHTKYKMLSTFSAQEMGWCTAIGDTHCCWSLPIPSCGIFEKMRLASDSIYKHLLLFTPWHFCHTDSQIASTIPYDGYPLTLSMGNGMMCCKDTHPLLLKYRKPFMACMRKLRWASDDIIYMPNVVYFVRFPLKFTLNLHPKYVILGTLSAWEMGWCATRRDIHCCMSVS